MSSFIFDVDGTLIDSYDGITKSVIDVLNKYDYKIDNVRDFILDKSVLDLLKEVSLKIGIPADILYNEYKIERKNTQFDYKFMDGAIEALKYLYSKGHKLFIYTHKGDAINKILMDNNIDNYFLEVISADSSVFKRKPDPYCINYLITKFELDKNNTYYVGDRKIDILCANNALIKSIYLGNNLKADIVIDSFYKLKQLF